MRVWRGDWTVACHHVTPSSFSLAPGRAAGRQTWIAARRHRQGSRGGLRPAGNTQQFLDVRGPALRTGNVITIKDELFKSVFAFSAREFVKRHYSLRSVVSARLHLAQSSW